MPWGDYPGAEGEEAADCDAQLAKRRKAERATSNLQDWERFLQSRTAQVAAATTTMARLVAPRSGADCGVGSLPGIQRAVATASWGNGASSTDDGDSCGGGALCWGEIPGERRKATPAGFAVELRLGGLVLHVEEGRRLAARSRTVCALLAASSAASDPSGSAVRVVNLGTAAGATQLGCTSATAQQDSTTIAPFGAAGALPPQVSIPAQALRAAVRFALTEQLMPKAELWQAASSPRPVAAASRDGEASEVEDALHCLDLVQAAELLALPNLEAEAEARLLGDPSHSGGGSLSGSGWAKGEGNGLVSDATALPLLGASFGRRRAVSAACRRVLADRALEVLRGRERQVGVLYATHPVAATLLSGIYRAAWEADREASKDAKGSASDGRDARVPEEVADTQVLDLLYGPRACNRGK